MLYYFSFCGLATFFCWLIQGLLVQLHSVGGMAESWALLGQRGWLSLPLHWSFILKGDSPRSVSSHGDSLRVPRESPKAPACFILCHGCWLLHWSKASHMANSRVDAGGYRYQRLDSLAYLGDNSPYPITPHEFWKLIKDN